MKLFDLSEKAEEVRSLIDTGLMNDSQISYFTGISQPYVNSLHWMNRYKKLLYKESYSKRPEVKRKNAERMRKVQRNPIQLEALSSIFGSTEAMSISHDIYGQWTGSRPVPEDLYVTEFFYHLHPDILFKEYLTQKTGSTGFMQSYILKGIWEILPSIHDFDHIIKEDEPMANESDQRSLEERKKELDEYLKGQQMWIES